MRLPLVTGNWIALVALGAALAGCGKKEEPSKNGTDPRGIAIAPPPNLNPGEVRKDALSLRQASGKTLFERVSADESGLDFVHRWAPRDEDERELITTSFAGGGVALGDIDNEIGRAHV